MRRSPQDSGRLPAPLLLLLALCMLFITLTPVASALSNAKENDSATLAVSAMQDGENGRVTDDDGIIGNSRHGADRAQTHDRFESGIRGGTRTGNADSPRDHLPRFDSDARSMDASDADNAGMIEENGTADDGNSSGILPWIIAAIVAVSIVLVVLALIPRKNRSR